MARMSDEEYAKHQEEMNRKLKAEYDKYWPAFEINLNMLAGSMEVGKTLHLTGLFSGFGGSFHTVHMSKEEAVEHLTKCPHSQGSCIFEVTVKELCYVTPDGKVIET